MKPLTQGLTNTLGRAFTEAAAQKQYRIEALIVILYAVKKIQKPCRQGQGAYSV
jgi:hypothetical protein